MQTATPAPLFFGALFILLMIAGSCLLLLLVPASEYGSEPSDGNENSNAPTNRQTENVAVSTATQLEENPAGFLGFLTKLGWAYLMLILATLCYAVCFFVAAALTPIFGDGVGSWAMLLPMIVLTPHAPLSAVLPIVMLYAWLFAVDEKRSSLLRNFAALVFLGSLAAPAVQVFFWN